MTLLRGSSLRLTFGSRTVLDDLTLTIEEGERVGLVGVNGSGKSSLMRILAGELAPDRGEVQLRRGTKVVYLPQEPVFAAGATVEGELGARPALRQALADHAALAGVVAEGGPGLDELAVLAERIEHLGGWDTGHQARILLDRLGVHEWERPVAELSGGTRKRVAIAGALLSAPDLLLLDEPTNHLDADTVDWLEEELDTLRCAILLVTHDRYFLDDLVDRIVEISPAGGVVSYPGNYQAYVEQKLIEDEEREQQAHKRGRWIAGEVAWLRRGVEARRTKSKARIERARKLMAARGPTRPRVAELRMAPPPRLSHKVIEAEGVGKRFGDRVVLKDVDLIVQEGERIGIVGRNGAGKTTLLKVLLGELAPDTGTVTLGARTKVAYYDQQRAQLDPEKTVYEAAWDEEWVQIGDRMVALRDHLDNLLFPVPMQRLQVKALSGGERNRLLLARLFLQGANVLVLDEPTNDLDIVTLNLLEGLLLEYRGSVLLVTHDRYVLDKVATAILAFEEDGRVVRYPGNYEMYRSLRQAPPAAIPPARAAPAPAPAPAPRPVARLSQKERRELDGMEATIEAAEVSRAALEARLADPAVWSLGAGVAELRAELAAAVTEVERLYARWQKLQDRSGGSPA